MPLIRIATRASPLALWQARWVAARLRRRHPGLAVRLVPVVSGGDRDRATALYAASTVGMFVKEIQAAVLAGEADCGVHSAKDLPTGLPAGLALAAVLPRADARDALVGAPSVAALPQGAVVGSSSLRRRVQLARLRPDLRFVAIRGNVETRLDQVRAGTVTATVLAMAGLARLGLLRRAQATPLAVLSDMVPAPAQGAVAVDCRAGDRRTAHLLSGIADAATAAAIHCERAVLAGLDGGCSLPLGCHAWRDREGRWHLAVSLGDAAGMECARFELVGSLRTLPPQALERLRA
jgi:hydroxymethylbilane synthase